MENNFVTLNKKDYFLITFIGLSFSLFSIPILSNLNLPFIKLSFATYLALMLFFVFFANLALFIASYISRFLPIAMQMAKFAAVGAFNTFLDWGIVNLLMSITGIFAGVGYAIFNGISFLAANSGSYFWNKYWTFSSGNQKPSTGNFFQFFGVTLVGLAVKVGVSSFIVNYVAHSASFTDARWANLGLAAGTLFALVWNFLGYKFIVFKK
jgi:putative flippase GtrA